MGEMLGCRYMLGCEVVGEGFINSLGDGLVIGSIFGEVGGFI